MGKPIVLLLLLLAGCALADVVDAATRTIVLLRHGHYVADSAADPERGPGLSALGVAQAHLAAARLAGEGGFDALYVSPMQRARDTAAAVAAMLPQRRFTTLDELRECTPPTRRTEVTDGATEASLADCKAQLERLFAAHFRAGEGQPATALMVCHGNVIRYLVTRALGVDSSAWLEMSVGHASVTKVLVEPDGRFKVIAVGDVGHLPANLRTGASGDPERSLTVPVLPTD